MRFRKIHGPRANASETSFRHHTVRPKRSGFLAAVALTSSILFGAADFAAPAAKAPVVEAKTAKPALDWKRTHLAIINGDEEERHRNNAARAAEAGKENGAASVHLAGLASEEQKGIRKYKGNHWGIEKIFRRLKNRTRKGDTVFVYITGHGKDGIFTLENGEEFEYGKLLELMEKNFGGRKIVFVSDACFSANFVQLLIESKGFLDVTAMSPGLQDETTTCNYFAQPFWHAVRTGLDLNGNGIATLEEAFYYALKEYRKLKPDTLGSYRKSIPEIKSMDEVEDGVVMVTAEWCGACKAMEPVFNITNLLLNENTKFYVIDLSNADYKGSIPALFIIKNSKKIASKKGSMEFKKFTAWLKENGIAIKEFEVSVGELYKQGKHDSIVLVSSWKEISKELGVAKAIDVLNSAAEHANPWVRDRATRILGNAAKKTDISAAVPGLAKLLSDKDAVVRWDAAIALGYAAGNESSRDLTLPLLMELLSDENIDVGWNAAIALGYAAKNESIRDVVFDLLVKALSDDKWKVREGAAYSLGNAALEVDIYATLPGLVKLLSDENSDVRVAAAWTLGNVAEKTDISTAVPGLVKLLPYDEEGRWAAMALGYAAINEKTRDDVLYLLMRALGDDLMEVRKFAALALGYAADKTDISAAVPGLVKLLSDKDDETRNYVVWALANAAVKTDISKAVPGLVKLLSDKDDEIRRSAARALGHTAKKTDISKAVPGLVKLLSDKDDEIRGNAVWALGNAALKTDISKAVPRLVKLLSDSYSDVRVDAARALGNTAKKTDISKAVPGLVKLLSDKNWEVRKNAAIALGNAAGETDITTAVPGLVKLLSDRDGIVQWGAAIALGNAAGNERSRDMTLTLLMRLLSDEDDVVRRNAAWALENVVEKTDMTTVVPGVVKLFFDADVRDAAKASEQHFKGKKAKPHLKTHR